jgi:tripeptidyl-peptidase-2
LREPGEAAQPAHFRVWVEPVFPKAADNRERLSFERRYRLQSTAPWIQPAKFLFVNGGGSPFEVIVDPTHLESGVHAAEVLGFEEDQEELGPAFRLPVTVIRPLRLEPTNHLSWAAEFPLKPGNIARRFFEVPQGANWAELKIRSKGVANVPPIGVSGVQLLAGARPDLVLDDWFPIRDGKEQMSRFHVTGGRTLEIVLANPAIEVSSSDPWFSLGLEFHGLKPGSSEAFFDGAARVQRVDVQAMTRPAELEPKAVLNTWRRSIPPTDADYHPLPTERDKLTEGRRLYELILSYTFDLDESASVTPRFPALYGRLYDGEFESQVRMWFDSNKRLIRVEENYHDVEPLRLGKGQHTLRLQLRYDRPDSLEKLKSLPLLLDQDLATRLTLAVCSNPDDALTGRAMFERYTLSPDESAFFYLAAPSGEQLAKAGKPGDLLIGTIRYEPEPSPLSYPLAFLVPPPEAKTSAKDSRKSPETKPLPEQLADARRDFEIAQLAKLNCPTNASLFNEQYYQLQSKYPGHLPLLAERLHCLDAEAREQHLRSVVAAADEVIQHIDTNRLASYFGLRSSPEDATTRKAHEEMQKQRDALVDALRRKATALADMEQPEKSHATNAPSSACEPPFDKAEIDRLFEETFSSLRRWVDTRQDDYVAVHRQWDWRHGRLGEALKLLRGQIEKKPTDRDLYEQQIRLLKELGWEHCVTNQERWLLRRFPKSYPRF